MATIITITATTMATGTTMAPTSEYLRDPAEITRRSFEQIGREIDLASLPPDIVPLAVRMVHACGMTDLIGDLAWSNGAGAAGKAALVAGAPLLVDVEMVAHGITAARLPADNSVICTLSDPAVPDIARRLATTRSAAALELWRESLGGAVVAIGNAPTALFRLLEMIAEGGPRPALVVATPPGFIGAAESKDALIANPFALPYLTVRGRRGGSPLAAAAINALATRENGQ